MSSIILPSRFYSQPQGAVDVESWAQGGLVISGEFDHANKAQRIGGSGTTSTEFGVHGKQRTYATGSDFYATPSTLDSLTEYTLFGLSKINAGSSGAYYGCGAKNRNSTTLNGVGTYNFGTAMYVEHGSGSCNSGATFLSNITTGDWVFWHITWDGTNVRFYTSGRLVNTVSYSAAITAGNGRFCTLSNRDQYNTNGAVALTGILPHCLDSGLIAKLAQNPWQIFKKRPRILYFGAGGGGGVSGTFTSALDDCLFSFSGTTTVVGNISSQLAATASDLTGAPVVTGDLDSVLEDATTSLSGTITITGSLTNALDDFLMELNGAIGSAISGSIDITLDDSTTALSGTSTVPGTITITLDIHEMDMSGTTTVVGALANQLEDVTAYFTGFPGAEGLVARLRTLLGCGT